MDPRPPDDAGPGWRLNENGEARWHAASNPRPPLPPLEDVDSLIARNAPIARTRKRRSADDNLLEQLQDAGARLRQRGRERDAARAEGATLQRERDEALRERDAARKQLAARNDMLAQVLKEQQY